MKELDARLRDEPEKTAIGRAVDQPRGAEVLDPRARRADFTLQRIALDGGPRTYGQVHPSRARVPREREDECFGASDREGVDQPEKTERLASLNTVRNSCQGYRPLHRPSSFLARSTQSSRNASNRVANLDRSMSAVRA